MIVEQIYTECLSQGSYYIESNGEVAIIDPLREIDPYIEKAARGKAKIKYVFETHFHADFVSGHLSISKKTGAPIVFGPNADTSFKSIIGVDGERFKIGKISLQLIHTPGHTMESTCYLLRDENDKEIAVFTGDTLFLGDVGRPDLSQKSSLSNKDLASMLFDSLRNKIMVLDDEVLVYPGHGQGTSCGKDLSSETIGKLGDQKLTNYALRENMTKDEFINEVLDGLSEPPKYFPFNVSLNKEGYLDSSTILNQSLKPLNVGYVENMMSKTTILDVRNPDEFAESHIPGSIFIGLEGRFAPWAGEILEDINQPIILITPNGKEEEAILRLSRVGFDNIKGYLLGGIKSWIEANKNIKSIENIDPKDFATLYSQNDLNILDVRTQSENNISSIRESLNIPLINLKDSIESINEKDKLYIHCKGGYRSMIACSILNSKSKTNIVNIKGGFDKISTLI